MEDAKSGYLETNFGGKHKDIKIGNVHVIVLANTAPDLSVLSVDRWRLWCLGGEDYENIIWPCSIRARLSSYDKGLKTVTWNTKLLNLIPDELLNNEKYKNIEILIDWHLTEHQSKPNEEIFGAFVQYTKDLVSLIPETPNCIRSILTRLRKNLNDKEILIFN